MTNEEAQEAYEKVSADFTEINKKYNRALRKDEMTDELELEFMRAEKFLKAAYKLQAQIAAKEAE